MRLWLVRRASIAWLFNAPGTRVLLTFGRRVLGALVEMLDQLGRVPAAFLLAVLAYRAFCSVTRSWRQSRKVLFDLWQRCSTSFALLAVRLRRDVDETGHDCCELRDGQGSCRRTPHLLRDQENHDHPDVHGSRLKSNPFRGPFTPYLLTTKQLIVLMFSMD